MLFPVVFLLFVIKHHNNENGVVRAFSSCCRHQPTAKIFRKHQNINFETTDKVDRTLSSIVRAAHSSEEVTKKDEEADSPYLVSWNSYNESLYRDTLLRVAKLSLEDYEWRSSIFKSNEAERMVEETIARLQGKTASYLRPMDASEEKIGPLGRLEKSAVNWLSQVIDEEGRRAKQIVALNGKLIRPIEADQLGPLGLMENKFVEFLRSIRFSEKERVRTRTNRPMDLEESIRGPLGQMEEAVSDFFKEIRESEQLRAEQSRSRGGAVVRPIDIPGPLGELELWIAEILKAEELRAAERPANDGRLVRPKDAKVKGPLGEVEQKAFDFLDQLSAEEKERLYNIQQYLQDSRPMENKRDSVLGVIEALAVGLIRSPLVIVGVINRVGELLQSEPLSAEDKQMMKNRNQSSWYANSANEP